MATFTLRSSCFCTRFPENKTLKIIHLTLRLKGSKSSSNKWLRRQHSDIFVKQAGLENYRCRSAFKLLQMDHKYNFLKPGHIVIDCGASPGSWCQVSAQRVNSYGQDRSKPQGMVIGIDLQPMAPLQGVHLLPMSDFTQPDTQNKVKKILGSRQANVVLSDMAPNATGHKFHNHEVIVQLCFTVLHFSLSVLKSGGVMVCKLWTGSEQKRLENAMQTVFENVKVVKPEASRSDSSELFLLGQGFKVARQAKSN